MMKKRIFCAFLAALMLFSLLPTAAVTVHAEEELHTSDAAVEILKEMEGFVQYAVEDHGQYSIGYGTQCDPSDYPNGITEAEAEQLLRMFLVVFEESVQTLQTRYQLTFTQNQFDALVLFSYNVGGNWVNSDGLFRSAVINGAKGNDFIYPFCLWSNASNVLNVNLVKRRLIEADMYLNGSYDNKVPANYTYVTFDNNGGNSNVKVQGYDSSLTARIQPEPTLSGSRFLGWYTQKEGGSWITKLTTAQATSKLYAHWQTGAGDAANGTAASYQLKANQLGALSTYDAPGGKAAGAITAGATVKIVADYVDGDGVKWGKCDDGKWVNIGDPLVGVTTPPAAAGTEVTVTAKELNIRSGPGTGYGVVAGAKKGDKLIITETKPNGTELWGKCAKGWVCLDYTTYKAPEEESTPPANPGEVIATGIVIDCTALRVHSSAGVSAPEVGAIPVGTRVYITKMEEVGGVMWGQISSGWICLTYVKLDSGETPDENPDDPDTGTSSTGVVTAAGGLNIRKGPGTNYAIMGAYKAGDRVTILEQTPVTGVVWGRTERGWISMEYVRLDSVTPPTTPTPETPTSIVGKEGVVNAKTALNIRKGPGINYAVVGAYKKGAKVTFLEQKSVNGVIWGRTDKGWISTEYVTFQTTTPETPTPTPTPSDPSAVKTGVINSKTGLNIRVGPGTNYAIVGGYKPGDKVSILEQRVNGGVTWGRTNKGWISMEYVLLDGAEKPADPEVPVIGVTNGIVSTRSGLVIRVAPSTTAAAVGSYSYGTKITILEQQVVNTVAWGRTDKGWVCLTYVNLGATVTPEVPPVTDPTANGTVISNSPLTIRKTPGINGEQVGSYVRGTRITILDQVAVAGVAWGRTDKGWVCLEYVQLDGAPTPGVFDVVITATSLAIRNAPGNGTVVGFYKQGTKVVVLQTTTFGGDQWGKTAHGWICLTYTKR